MDFLIRFPDTLLEEEGMESNNSLNYCDLVIGGNEASPGTTASKGHLVPPKSAFPAVSLQKGTNYARIDPLATRAAKDVRMTL